MKSIWFGVNNSRKPLSVGYLTHPLQSYLVVKTQHSRCLIVHKLDQDLFHLLMFREIVICHDWDCHAIQYNK